MEGWIMIHRKIKDHWVWKDPVKFQWWIDILLSVNHDDAKVNIGMNLYDCKRGQSIMSLQNWAQRWRVSKTKVRAFLKLLEKDNMLLIESLTKTTRITVCNYDSYQQVSNATKTQKKRNENATKTLPYPNNNDKNDNNEKKENVPPVIQPNIFDKNLKECLEELSKDAIWYEPVCMNNHISPETFQNFLKDFFIKLQNEGETKKCIKDAKSHFSRWLKIELEKQKQNGTDRKLTKEQKKQGLIDEFKLIASGEKRTPSEGEVLNF